jgi:hypothetical protein
VARKQCGASLTLYGEQYRCDRRRGHTKASHRERMYGCDDRGTYVTVVRWERWTDPRA